MSVLDSTPIDEAVRLADGSFRVARKLGRLLAHGALDDAGSRLAEISESGIPALVAIAQAFGVDRENLAILAVLREPLPWRRSDRLDWDHRLILADSVDSDGTIFPIDDRVGPAIRERLGEEIELEGHGLLVDAFGHRHSAEADLSRKERDYWTRQGPEHLVGAGDPAGAAALLRDASWFVERLRLVGVDAAWPDGVEDEALQALLRRHHDVLRRTPAAWPSLLYHDCIVREMHPKEIEQEHGIRAVELPMRLSRKDVDPRRGSSDFEPHGPIVGLAVEPDGATAISADRGGMQRWSLHEDGVARSEAGPFVDVTVTRAGDRQVTASPSGPLAIWSTDAATPERLDGHADGSLCVAVSPDDALLASGGRDHAVAVWDLRGRKLVRRFAGHAADVVDVAWTTDGKEVVSASADGTVRVWTVDGASADARLVLSVDGATPTACHVHGDWAVVGFDDGSLRAYQLDDGAEQMSERTHAGAIRAIVTHEDGRTFTASDDRTIHAWLTDRREPVVLRAHAEGVTCLAIAGDRLLSGSRDHTMIAWDLETLEPIRRYGGYGLPREMVDRPDVVRPPVSLDLGHRVYEGHADGRIVLRADGGGDRVHRCRSGVSSLHVGEKGVVVGTDDGTIESLSAGLEFEHSLRGHRRRVNGLALLDDGRLLSWSLDATLRLWDLDAGKLLATTHGAAPFVVVDLDPSDPLRFTAEDADGARWEMAVAPREGEEPRPDAAAAGAAPFDVA